MRTRGKVLALALAAILVLAVVGVAAAQTAPSTPTSGATDYHQVFLGKLAQILGVDQAKLESAMVQAQGQTLDQAVKDGRLTQQQADWMKQRQQQVQQGGVGFGFGPGFGPGPMMRGGFGGHGPYGGPHGGPFGGPPWAVPATPTPSP